MIADTLKIKIQKSSKSRLDEVDVNNVPFGRQFADHMYIANYKDGQWTEAKIIPYEKLSLSPASSMMHYGQAIFEGMKAYKSVNGDVQMFRPLDNHKRMNISAERMAMPLIPEDIFMEGLVELLKLDKGWVPTAEGSSLYIRPLFIGTDEYIGVKPSESYKFLIFTAPVGHYYLEPVKVLVETNYIRAVEGGVGYVKASGNYGRSLYPTKLAQLKGYDQIIWTDARHHRYVEESGTMNLMFVIDNVLITPPTGDTILAGITRDSVLTLAHDWNMKVEERKIGIDEVLEAHENKTLQEAFGTGTAATIAHISLLGFEGKDYELPPVETRIFSNRAANELDGIRKGKIRDRHNWMYKI
jgi:branched-chain amino acid aminotransferase